MPTAQAYAASSPTSALSHLSIPRRDPTDRDVEIEILFCGVCHSDLHTARGEWTGTVYPCVPGHEIVGRVARVGSEVKGFEDRLDARVLRRIQALRPGHAHPAALLTVKGCHSCSATAGMRRKT